MEYSDYFNIPEVHKEFDIVFERARERFKIECEKHGLDKEQSEVISIKAASVEADSYLSKMFRRLEKTNE
jgi:hypothetical protein